MHASKEKTTSLEMMLSRSYSSKEEFSKEYKKLCFENSKAKEFYLLVLIELAKAISEDDIESFKKLSTLIGYTSDLESKVTLEECYDNTDNPIRSTNLVILASKHNGIKILRYLLDSDGELLNNLSVGIGKESTSPKDEDEVHHNAFYYAIRSEDIHLLDTLITNKYFNNYFAVHSEELEEILSKTYEELQLKNVPLSDEMQYFVEHKLIDRRFFSTGQHPSSNITDVHILTKNRIELLLHSISVLKRDYLKTNKVDGKFLYITKFIAQNIHILKGRLRSTYDRIPWEEMEFCLVIFVSSQTSIEELNIFYRTILNKDKILFFLEHFSNILRDYEDITTKGGERKTREDNVKNIIAAYPQFKELYDDYHQIRDVYSLKRVSDHIKLASSADAQEEHGKLIIIRVLQVIGEHLKNTPQSPKLSHSNSELLVLLLSKNAIKVITELRDAISHAALSKIEEIEQTADSSFLINIQGDIGKVGDMITEILYKNKIKTVRLLLKKGVDSKTPDETKEVLEELNSVEIGVTATDYFKTVKYEKLKKLIKELNDSISNKNNYVNNIFKKLNSIISLEENKTKNTMFDYLRAYGYLKIWNVELNSNNYTDEYLIEKFKNEANKMFNSITAQISSEGLQEIVSLSAQICRIVKSRIQNNYVEVLKLTIQINFIVEFETREIKWINELKEHLNKTKTKKKKKKITPAEEQYTNNQLELKICELNSMLHKNSLSDIKNNAKLQCVVKMFVLDIMSILDNREDYLQNNILFLDDNTPLLHGKCLRNYLAHDNALVDVLLPDPITAVIINAKKLTAENISESTKKIGKLVSDDPVKLRQKFDRYLNTIAHQERMFVALKEGNLDVLKDCIEKGADIKARSIINSWTTLHFAASGPSLEVVKFILDRNLSINAKDNGGDTPLHIAAAHGRRDIVRLFCEETDISVDVLNNKHETPLNVAVQAGHTNIVEDLLKYKTGIVTQDPRCFSPLFYAISYNCIDDVKILLGKDLNFDIDETMFGLTALQLAALRGHLELVNVLLESGANIKATTDKNEEPLHLAVTSGNLEVVNALILQGANVNARNCNDWMPLHYAANFCNFNMVISLLTNGAHVNIASTAASPLHIAAWCGNLEIVAALLEHGANIHDKLNKNDATPLHYAAQNGHEEVVEFLIQKGAQIHSTKNNNFTALHEAVVYGHKHVAHLLIKKKSEINAKSTEGFTPMHIAAQNNNTEIIDLLLRNAGDVRARSTDGWSPLYLAVKEGHKAASDFLIKNEADVNERDNDGVTPLHIAVLHGHKEIVNLLIENNVQVNLEDNGDIQPLHVAAMAGHKEIVEILIAKEANINAKHNKQTPLLCAVNNNHKEVVEFLIEKGAIINVEDIETWSLPVIAGFSDIVDILIKNNAYDADYKDSNRYTPLHFAAINGHKKIVKALIANGADVHAISVNNKTPLLCASQEGFEDVVEILIARGADLNLKNNQDNTPLRAAAKGGHSKVVKVLLDYKVDVDVHDTTNNAPIRLAVAGGHLEVVKIFLEHMKVNIDTKGEDGFTLLHIASQGTNLELVKYLVDEGSDINAATSNGHKAIHLAAGKGYKDTVEYFVEKGSSLNELGAQGMTLLHCAAMGGHLEVVNYLLKHHADVNATETENGFTPMHFAAAGGHTEVLRVLLENDAIYNAEDRFNRKPLELANNKAVIKLLESTDKLFKSLERNNYLAVQNYITEGAIVNALNAKGVRPLHCAAKNGNDKLVRVLLENKANPNVVDNKGLTPLHYAAQISHLKIVKLLLSYYAVYDAVSLDDKTPSDMTEDKSIIALFKSVSDSFKYIEIDNCQVIDDLNKIRDIDTIKAIMCARNRQNRTLVVAAIHSNFSKVQQLKEIGQGDVSAQINKAIELLELEHFQEALLIFEEAFKKRKEILGSDNPGTLDIQKYIAKVLRDQGDYKEALNAFESILQKQTEMLDFESKDILNTRSLIASVMCRQGKNEKAFSIFQEVYQNQIDLMGFHDEDTRWETALILAEQGKHEEALNIFKSVYKNTKPDDLLRAMTVQYNMALVLTKQHNYEQAKHIYEEIYEKMKVVLGLNHSVTLEILGKIGKILAKQEKYNKALAVFQKVLYVQEKVLKPTHPDIIKTKFNIGNVLFAQEKWISALKVYQEELDKMKEVFESHNPYIVHIINQIEKINFMLKLEGDEPSKIIRHLQRNINIAAGKGDIQTLQRMLDDGADANNKDQDGRTPLHCAICNGHVDVTNILLKHGADVTRVTNRGHTPLHTAVLQGHIEIAEVLLRHVKPDALNYIINAKSTDTGATSLHVAAINGSLDIAMSLLKRGAIYNITNNEDKTPLDLCKDQKVINMLKLVEELFQDVEVGNIKILKKLKVLKPDEYEAVKNVRNSQNYTLLQVFHRAIRRNVPE